MKRLKLLRPVRIEGYDFWNRRSLLIIEPLSKNTDAWYWRVDGKDLPVTSKLMALGPWGRTVSLQFEEHRLNEFEHLAFLHMLGLRNVRVELIGSDWPPYMCSEALWEKALLSLWPDGVLEPFVPHAKREERFGKQPRLRQVIYVPMDNEVEIRAEVDYGPGKQGSAQFCITEKAHPSWDASIAQIVRARTLGRPNVLRILAGVFGWKHYSKVLWLPSDHCEYTYHELAQHKILDGMLLSFAAPRGMFLSGSIIFRASDHAMDLALLRALEPQKIAQFRSATAA